MSRVVVVTGASRGIGRAAARLFAQKGDRVVLNYCASRGQALSLAEELKSQGAEALPFQADVSDPGAVKAMFLAAEKAYGGVDVLINNAGVSVTGLFTDLSPEAWRRLFDVNVLGTFLCCQQAVPYFLRNHRGKIVNLSSVWGLAGASCEAAYSASKAAVVGLTKALAKELGPSGIQVNCVAPGVIDTDMNAALAPSILEQLAEETPLGVLGTPEDVAQAIYFLASPQADFITGQVLSPNGGFLI